MSFQASFWWGTLGARRGLRDAPRVGLAGTQLRRHVPMSRASWTRPGPVLAAPGAIGEATGESQSCRARVCAVSRLLPMPPAAV
ncbi:hypothetical protein K505DRAFT_126814 [Melanomma pulvis-pyrius CBS 109.77]|uniref:Uncharacterized protein n=1 Tax=Melanomma pulvis-pyrius CBS 109.77 TaxID=1314802 RepID=A0A6A6WTI6_9PLEO|nr:hypothetical protein K505DRAFT_126814 [Melanomma pulvis-pyrius CBS 109.77]